MLDIGWSELLVLVIAAVVVVGPKDLPRLMRTVGRYTGKARALAREFRSSFDELGRETELEEINREMNRIHREDPIARKTALVAPPPTEKKPHKTHKTPQPPKPQSAAPPRPDAAPPDATE